MTCTFFGHSYIFEDIAFNVEESIRCLIENNGVNKFYVGTHGNFDIRIMLSHILKILTAPARRSMPHLPRKRVKG